ncbi:5-oxoprolinase subunit PxpA [Thalassotalea atypica]|uniref:5-oxoprolinase subunit PxpA n=1 Tax=Thalassotalea atypica TaxID=2054316 RepID=UPI002572A817|nr:5-oxoprolinase subunit PxpA [Thalassotalea atypica]
MKLNCDLGESFGQWSKGADEHIMPLIDLANIACGFHAGDPETMAHTVELAVNANVTIGAHPGYPDLVGFGRRSIKLSQSELKTTVQYQVGALQALCKAQKTQVSYVKPHGAMYNDMMSSIEIFETICQAIAELDDSLVLILQALPDMSRYHQVAKRYNISLLHEAFADRNYQDNGLLVDRKQANAVITDAKLVCQRIKHYNETKNLLSEHGAELPIKVDTFCVHGDNLHALELVKRIKHMLEQNK